MYQLYSDALEANEFIAAARVLSSLGWTQASMGALAVLLVLISRPLS